MLINNASKYSDKCELTRQAPGSKRDSGGEDEVEIEAAELLLGCAKRKSKSELRRGMTAEKE